MKGQTKTGFLVLKNPRSTIAGLLAIFAAGALCAWWMVRWAERDLCTDVLQQTEMVAQAISAESIKELAGTEADLASPAYLRLKEDLATVRSSLPQCRFVYLLGRKPDGTLFLFLDSEPIESKDYSPPGQVYSEAPQGFHRVFATRTSTTEGPYTDRWGKWFSAMTPIFDPQTVMDGLASVDDAEMMVRKAVEFYRQNGRERFLKEVNNPQGAFRKGDLYAFVYDRNMTWVAHPVKPELVGQNWINRKDWPGGKLFRREIQEVARTKGHGWVEYEYENFLSKQLDLKTTCFEGVDDLIICAGAYRGDGKVVAALGMDIDASVWNRLLVWSALPTAALTLVLAALLLVGSALVARRSQMPPAQSGRLQNIEPALLFATGLALTLFACWTMHERELQDRRRAFEQLAKSRSQNLAETFYNLRDTGLEGLAYFFESNAQITGNEFKRFTSYLTKNPSIQAWEWAPAVQAADRLRFETDARAAGMDGFRIWQKSTKGAVEPAAGRAMYFPVLYVAPMTGNERVLGYDLGSEAVRRTALEAAQNTGLPTATDPVTLVQEAGTQKGMLIFRPVFDREVPRHLRGFVLSVLRMKTLLRSILSDGSVRMEFSLLRKDGSSVPLAGSVETKDRSPTDLTITRPIFAFGKVFSVTVHSGQEFLNANSVQKAWIVGLMGIVLTSALTLGAYSIRRRRERLEQLVLDRTTELRESEFRLRAITDSAQDAILMMDPEGQISYWNPAAERIFGYTRAEALGKNLHSLLVPARHHTAHQAAFPEFLKTGAGAAVGKTLDLEALRKDGMEISVQVSLSSIRIHEEWHAVGILRDVSERKLAEEKLRLTNIQLQEATGRAEELASQSQTASLAKSAFLAAMSHEIRTPLNGILGSTEILSRSELRDDQNELIQMILTSGDLLLSTINDILDFSKIEAGKIEIEEVDFRLIAEVDKVLDVVTPAARKKGLELAFIPEPGIPAVVRSDVTRLRQVLVNLVGNAIKFTERGWVTIHCEKRPSGRIRFQVRDSGIGISEEKLAGLFEPFTQADSSTTRKYGGSGLGLAISHRLVRIMGGELRVESKLGAGSCFSFELPIPAVNAEMPQKGWETELEADLRGHKALVIDDTEVNLRLVYHAFAAAGGDTILADSLETGLKLLRLHPEIDLILLDRFLPDTDGEESVQELRRSNPSNCPPVILLASDIQSVDRKRFAAVLQKPLKLRTLVSTCESVLSSTTKRQTSTNLPGDGQCEETSLRVLLAEDNEVNQKISGIFLNSLGVSSISLASNGREAVEQWKHGEFDLVFMDCQMPEMDGYEATRLIREEERSRGGALHQIIVGLSAGALSEDRNSAMVAGMDDYLVKPLKRNDLSLCLNKWSKKAEEKNP